MDSASTIRPGGASAQGFDCCVLPVEWAEFGVRFGTDGRLYFSEWRAGFTVHQARAMFFECQRLRSLERDLLNAQAEVETMQCRLDEAEKAKAFYRSQLCLESTMGAMLGRIAGPR